MLVKLTKLKYVILYSSNFEKMKVPLAFNNKKDTATFANAVTQLWGCLII